MSISNEKQFLWDIRDQDIADEMVSYSKHSILSQVSQSLLAQANKNAQGVLGLLE